MAKKKTTKKESKKPKKVSEPKKVQKYFVKDAHDRFYNKEDHGFDLELRVGVAVEVSADTVKKIKKDYPYLTIE